MVILDLSSLESARFGIAGWDFGFNRHLCYSVLVLKSVLCAFEGNKWWLWTTIEYLSMEIFHRAGGTSLLTCIIVKVPKMDGGSQLGTRQWSKAGRENEILYDLTCVWNLKKEKTDRNREEIGGCQRQVRGCGAGGWNERRMSEKEKSKKNVGSIS